MGFKSHAEPAMFLFEPFRTDNGGIEEYGQHVLPLAQKAPDRKPVFDEHIRGGSHDTAVAADRRVRVEPAGDKVDRPLLEEGAGNGELLPVLPSHAVDPLHIVFLHPVERIGDEPACHEIGVNSSRHRCIQPPECLPVTGVLCAAPGKPPEFPRPAEIECFHFMRTIF